MKGCSFITKEIPAYVGNYTKNRARYGKISEITVHHAAGIVSVDALGQLWQKKGRAGSSHYGVSGAQIGQYVSEDDIAWTNSNWSANLPRRSQSRYRTAPAHRIGRYRTPVCKRL